MKTNKKLCFVIFLIMIGGLFFQMNTKAETITNFSDSSTEKEIEFQEAGIDSNTDISIPKRAEINNAKIDISTINTILNPIIDIGEDESYEWTFSEEWYDSFGHQTTFYNNLDSSFAHFNKKDSNTNTSIMLPKKGEITKAFLDINGFPIISTSIGNQKVLSGGTDKGKLSDHPSILSTENKVYVVWKEENAILFKKSTDYGNSWNKEKIIYLHNNLVVIPELRPSISIGDNTIYIAFYNFTGCYITRSEDYGDSWSEFVEITKGEHIKIASDDNDNVYAVYTKVLGYDRDIYFKKSNNKGESWEPERWISDDINDGNFSLNPTIATDNSDHVYITWSDDGNIDNSGTDYDIIFKKSNDNGNTWSITSTVISDSKQSSSLPFITADENNNVYIAWEEYVHNGESNKKILLRKSNDAGVSWNEIEKVSTNDDSNDRDPWISINEKNENKVYVTWGKKDILLKKSDDYGTSWGEIQLISDDPNDGNSKLSSISATDNNIYILWVDNGNISGSGRDYDVMVRNSPDDGISWSETIVLYNIIVDGDSCYPDATKGKNDDIYLVYTDNGNLNGNGRDGDIFLIVSHDYGKTWNKPIVISDDENDGLSSYPSIASDNNGCIYVVWEDNGNIDDCGDDIDIMFKKSEDGGKTWIKTMVISKNNDGTSDMPTISCDDNGNVYVVWQDNSRRGDVDRWDFDILFRKSTDFGKNWGDVKIISNPDINSDNRSFYPSITAKNENIYTVWCSNENISTNGEDYDVLLKQSNNYGDSWTDTPYIISDDTNDPNNEYDSWAPSIVTDDKGGVYITWMASGNISENDGSDDFDAVFKNSKDYGATWTEKTYLISLNKGYTRWDYKKFPEPKIGVNNDGIFIIWEDKYRYNNQDDSYYSKILFSSSYDGSFWKYGEDIITRKTPSGNIIYFQAKKPIIVTASEKILIMWEDNYDEQGSGYDFDILLRNISTSEKNYPKDIKLDFGNDDSEEWSFNEELNLKNSPQTVNIDLEYFNQLIQDSGIYFTDDFGNEFVEIPINITSESPGIIILSNLSIKYDYTATIDFTDSLNELVPDKGNGNIEIPIAVSSSSSGKIKLSNLYVEYELNEIPVAKLTSDKAKAKTDEEIKFYGYNSTDDGILEYKYDFGDGEIRSWSSNPNATHFYSKSENHKFLVNLSVKDEKDEINWTSIEVIINNPPIANAGEDIQVKVSENVNFDASNSYDEDEDSLTYFWDFGDSNFGEGMKPTYTYDKSGKYFANLTVSDEIDESKDSVMIHVIHYGVKLEISPSEKNVNAGGKAIYKIEITNTGSDEDTISLNIEEEKSWSVIKDKKGNKIEDVQIDINNSTTVFLEVQIPKDTKPTNYEIKVNGICADEITSSSVSTITKVNELYGVELEIKPSTSETIDPEETIDYTITVTNIGNTKDEVELKTKDIPSDWTIEFSKSKVNLEPNNFEKVTLSITPAEKAKAELYSLLVFAILGNGEESNTIFINLSVNKFTLINISIDNNSKEVEIGGKVNYEIILKNDGNNDEIINLSFSNAPGEWKVELLEETIFLKIGETKNVNLIVFALESEEKDIAEITVTATVNDEIVGSIKVITKVKQEEKNREDSGFKGIFFIPIIGVILAVIGFLAYRKLFFEDEYEDDDKDYENDEDYEEDYS